MTIRELATASAVSESTIVNIESGEPARFDTIRKLASALKITPEELVETSPN
jgi:transcriptional regulator with XRE-family HTH domain